MNGSKFETNMENGETRMTNDERSRKPVPRAPNERRLGEPSLLESRFQRLIMRVSNPWGDAPGCNDVAPLALKHTQAACGFD